MSLTYVKPSDAANLPSCPISRASWLNFLSTYPEPFPILKHRKHYLPGSKQKFLTSIGVCSGLCTASTIRGATVKS